MSAGLYLQKVGQRLRTEREELGLSQVDVAEALGVSDTAISNWELGKATMSVITDKRLRVFFRQKRKAMASSTEVSA